jgi:hypothetical protein
MDLVFYALNILIHSFFHAKIVQIQSVSAWPGYRTGRSPHTDSCYSLILSMDLWVLVVKFKK